MMCRSCNCVPLMGMQNAKAAMEKSRACPQKKKGIKLPTCGPIISPLDVCPQKPESRDLNRYLYIHKHNSKTSLVDQW